MENHLTRLKDFQKVLNNYTISSSGKEILKKANLALLAAATSTGRNTIIRELLKGEEYYFLVSDTTRKPRENDGTMEQDGVVYWFRTEDEILADLEQGRFLEAAIIHDQQVSGISLRELEKATKANKIAITDIEVVGVDNIMKLKPEALAMFVLPPSFDEWQDRLAGRGAMPKAEVKRRMQSAAKEFAAALEHDYYKFIVNDTIPHALEQIYTLAFLRKVDPLEQRQHRDLAERLYNQTLEYLNKL